MTLQAIAAAAGWIVIILPLLSLLINSKRSKGRTIGSGSALRKWPVVTAITALFILLAFLLWKPLPIQPPDWPGWVLPALGAVLYFPGLILYLWGWVSLGKAYGVSNYGGADLYEGQQLITHGPYRLVRHPMYLAVMTAALGALLIFQTWAMVIFTLLSLVVIRRSNQEEALLESEFGPEWQDYQSRVPKWFPTLKRNK